MSLGNQQTIQEKISQFGKVEMLQLGKTLSHDTILQMSLPPNNPLPPVVAPGVPNAVDVLVEPNKLPVLLGVVPNPVEAAVNNVRRIVKLQTGRFIY